MATRQLTTKQVVNLASDPVSGTPGEIYYNTADNVFKYYNGSAWTTLTSGGGGASNSFTTIDVPNGTDPVADSATDTLTFTESNGIIITGTSSTDTIGFSTNATALNTASTIVARDADQAFDITAVDFDTVDTIASAVGRLKWDDGEGTLSVLLKGGNVNLQIGQENVALCYNGTGSTIPNGSVVYISGAQGQRPSIALADADLEATSSKTFGVTTESIADGAEGFVATFGVVNNLDTSAFTAGQALYLSSTPGQLTTTKPVAPVNMVFVGYCLHVNSSSGRIFVNPQNGYEIEELHDVLITSIADNHILSYDNTTSLWKNQGLAAAIQEVDGAGSSIDADLLDGQHGSHYLDWTNTTNKPDPTITLAGDLSGSVTLTDLANGTLTATIAANSVELGTDTTGNYVATISGTANQVSVSGSGSESASITLSTPQDIHSGASPIFAGATLDAVQIGITAAGEIDTSSGNLTLDSSGGTVTVDDNLIVTGDFTVNGTTTTIDTTTLLVEDKNIELGVVSVPSDTTADGGGITLKGATDKTFNWVDATDAWTSSEHLNLANGKGFYINGTSVLSSTALGSGVTSSSLASVGTITSGTWQGSVIGDSYIDSTIARLASPTFTGKVTTSASTTSTAGFNIPHGTGPTAPSDGDIWTTTLGIYVRVNGETVGPLGAGGGTQEVFYQTTAPSTPETGTIWVDSDEVPTTLNTNDFALKASPAFTGTPTAPTAAAGTNTTQIATTAFVNVEISNDAILKTGGTLTGTLIAAAATTSISSINIPHGTAPTAPSNGDIWTTTLGLFGRINGTTEQFATKTYVDASSGGLDPFLLGGM